MFSSAGRKINNPNASIGILIIVMLNLFQHPLIHLCQAAQWIGFACLRFAPAPKEVRDDRRTLQAAGNKSLSEK